MRTAEASDLMLFFISLVSFKFSMVVGENEEDDSSCLQNKSLR